MVPRIHVLSPSIAERIAAGEVIERPASVAKELMENSLDAGATEIAVVLEQGGKELIEILDNGYGMSPEDLELCIERHATSKLNSLEDLESISTLGFRGEALSSIAAVTDLQIISRTQNSDAAYELLAGDLTGRLILKPKAGKITFGHFINTPHGTRIRARGLFSQIPARLKFLKSQSAEVSQIREWIERLAIAHPHVGFHLISEDRTVLRLPPSDEATRIRTILADGEDYPLVTVSNDQDGVRDVGLRIRLHWLQGLSSPQSRKLIQIVNGRAVRDRVLQQAILAPFRQLLLPGQFPAVALLIEINPAAIDVNVHPTKTEIRFLDSRKIFSAVDSLVKAIIAREGAPAISRSFAPSWKASESPQGSPSPWPSTAYQPRFSESPSFSASAPSVMLSNDPSTYSPAGASAYPPTDVGTSSSIFSAAPAHPLAQARYVGSLFQTYLVYESSGEMILVDQHAAHERVRYEKLRQRVLGSPSKPVALSSQALLLPEVVRFPRENQALLTGRLSWLSRLGFETEIFGEDALVFRAVPTEWGTKQLKIRLKNLIERVLSSESGPESDGSPLLLDESLFESLASEACHSAIRAGDPLEDLESKELVKQLFDCEHPWNCPHGRPTVVKVPHGKLEEWFLRKV